MDTSGRSVVGAIALLVLTRFAVPAAAQPVAATTTRTMTQASLGLTAVGTEVSLPPGQWNVTAIAPPGALDQVFLAPVTAADAPPLGRRTLVTQIEKNNRSGSSRVWQLMSACLDYAPTHGGNGPASLSDLDPERHGFLVKELARSPWPEDADKPLEGPLYFLVPNTPVHATAFRDSPSGSGRQPQPGGRAAVGTARPVPVVPMILELRPYIDDGKHWVGYSNGTVRRVDVDKALLAKHNLTLTFARRKDAPTEPVNPKADVRYRVFALLRDPAAATASVTLTDAVSNRRLDLRWALDRKGARPDALLLHEWATARAAVWRLLAEHGDATILGAWTALSQKLYRGTAPTAAPAQPQPPTFRDAGPETRNVDTFSVLGGRAALRETLQLQLLRGTAPLSAEPAVPVSTLKGVEVKSLPFDTMLAGRPGGRLALAEAVPADRLFVYFARPAAVFPLLNGGGNFLARTGSLFSSSSHDDNLTQRYLRRLGLTEDEGRRFLESGEVTELAMLTPDLFFLDGTDMTVVMRVRSPDTVAAALRSLGIVDLKGADITEKPVSPGHAAYWARHGDLLCLSTSRGELSQVMTLAAGGPAAANSLARSAEFRYMLTELPVKPETRGLVYLSDPFIRRMVGPALKIAQLRRVMARADMALITAGALLAKLDGGRGALDLPALVDLGYVPRTVAAANYRLLGDGAVVSPTWGSPAEMTPIDTSAITMVTASEAQLYQDYMSAYNRFWRQYLRPDRHAARRRAGRRAGAVDVHPAAGRQPALQHGTGHDRDARARHGAARARDHAGAGAAGLAESDRRLLDQAGRRMERSLLPLHRDQPGDLRPDRTRVPPRAAGFGPDPRRRNGRHPGRVRQHAVRGERGGVPHPGRAGSPDPPLQGLRRAAGPRAGDRPAAARYAGPRRHRREAHRGSQRRLPSGRGPRRLDLHAGRAGHHDDSPRARGAARLPRVQQHPVVTTRDDHRRRSAAAQRRGDARHAGGGAAGAGGPLRDAGRAEPGGGARKHGVAAAAAAGRERDAGRGRDEARDAVRIAAAASGAGHVGMEGRRAREQRLRQRDAMEGADLQPRDGATSACSRARRSSTSTCSSRPAG